MNQQRTIERESLTTATYHLKLAIEYMEDFKRDCKFQAKADAGRWLQSMTNTINSIYLALTPESRERFKQELKENDVLFFPAISNKLLQMTPEQREFMETIADGILTGEQIIFERS